jgi:hypothetical protein
LGSALAVLGTMFVVLSPELRPKALTAQLRKLRYPRCVESRHTIDWALERIYRSTSWAKFELYVEHRAPSDHWREGCWRFAAFDARYGEEMATAVFAIRLPPGQPVVRAALLSAADVVVAVLVERGGRRYLRRRPFAGRAVVSAEGAR